MYKSLYEIGSAHAPTVDKKYSCSSYDDKYSFNGSDKYLQSCPNLAAPSPSKFNPFYADFPTPYYNREYYQDPNQVSSETPFFPSVDNTVPQVVQQYNPNSPHLPPNITPFDPNSTNFYATELYNKTPIKSLQTPQPVLTGKTLIGEPVHAEKESLLPVLDCRFNLREICKQCILLEDHLSHDKKRCYDCCIKHFLAIEGLSEEAVTLDKEAKYKDVLCEIPDKVRQIQKFWYEDPESNSHQASQMLRELRKDFMQKTFNIGFDSSASESGSCAGGVCKIKKKM
jgi:hypothetical protein